MFDLNRWLFIAAALASVSFNPNLTPAAGDSASLFVNAAPHPAANAAVDSDFWKPSTKSKIAERKRLAEGVAINGMTRPDLGDGNGKFGVRKGDSVPEAVAAPQPPPPPPLPSKGSGTLRQPPPKSPAPKAVASHQPITAVNSGPRKAAQVLSEVKPQIKQGAAERALAAAHSTSEAPRKSPVPEAPRKSRPETTSALNMVLKDKTSKPQQQPTGFITSVKPKMHIAGIELPAEIADFKKTNAPASSTINRLPVSRPTTTKKAEIKKEISLPKKEREISAPKIDDTEKVAATIEEKVEIIKTESGSSDAPQAEEVEIKKETTVEVTHNALVDELKAAKEDPKDEILTGSTVLKDGTGPWIRKIGEIVSANASSAFSEVPKQTSSVVVEQRPYIVNGVAKGGSTSTSTPQPASKTLLAQRIAASLSPAKKLRESTLKGLAEPAREAKAEEEKEKARKARKEKTVDAESDSKDLNDEDLAEVRPNSKAISLPVLGKNKTKEQQKPTTSSKLPKQGKTSRAVAVAKPRKTASPVKRNGKQLETIEEEEEEEERKEEEVVEEPVPTANPKSKKKKTAKVDVAATFTEEIESTEPISEDEPKIAVDAHDEIEDKKKKMLQTLTEDTPVTPIVSKVAQKAKKKKVSAMPTITESEDSEDKDKEVVKKVAQESVKPKKKKKVVDEKRINEEVTEEITIAEDPIKDEVKVDEKISSTKTRRNKKTTQTLDLQSEITPEAAGSGSDTEGNNISKRRRRKKKTTTKAASTRNFDEDIDTIPTGGVAAPLIAEEVKKFASKMPKQAKFKNVDAVRSDIQVKSATPKITAAAHPLLEAEASESESSDTSDGDLPLKRKGKKRKNKNKDLIIGEAAEAKASKAAALVRDNDDDYYDEVHLVEEVYLHTTITRTSTLIPAKKSQAYETVAPAAETESANKVTGVKPRVRLQMKHEHNAPDGSGTTLEAHTSLGVAQVTATPVKAPKAGLPRLISAMSNIIPKISHAPKVAVGSAVTPDVPKVAQIPVVQQPVATLSPIQQPVVTPQAPVAVAPAPISAAVVPPHADNDNSIARSLSFLPSGQAIRQRTSAVPYTVPISQVVQPINTVNAPAVVPPVVPVHTPAVTRVIPAITFAEVTPAAQHSNPEVIEKTTPYGPTTVSEYYSITSGAPEGKYTERPWHLPYHVRGAIHTSASLTTFVMYPTFISTTTSTVYGSYIDDEWTTVNDKPAWPMGLGVDDPGDPKPPKFQPPPHGTEEREILRKKGEHWHKYDGIVSVAKTVAIPGYEHHKQCGFSWYNPLLYNCYQGDILCPIINDNPTILCRDACYLPDHYDCVQGTLLEKDTHVKARADAQSPLEPVLERIEEHEWTWHQTAMPFSGLMYKNKVNLGKLDEERLRVEQSGDLDGDA